MGWRVPFLFLALAAAALAQDEQRVISPDGAIDFRLFINQPEPGGLSRLAYEVRYRSKIILDTSYLGLEIYDQEPLLAENAGLMSAKTAETNRYHSLLAQYMQNGSLGRRINVEVRVYNDGVAFRYLVPTSTPLVDLTIADEVTEFDLPEAPAPNASLALPYVAEQPGTGWLSISEVPRVGYPPMHLMRWNGGVLITRLARLPGKSMMAFAGEPPLTCAWRIVQIGPTRESVNGHELAADLEH
jgi:alpha-glucosidase